MTHLFLVLSALIMSAAHAPDNYPKNPDVDVLHYRFQLALSDETDVVRGEAWVDVRFLAPGINRLRFDLIKASAERQGRGMRVISVAIDGAMVPFVHEDD